MMFFCLAVVLIPYGYFVGQILSLRLVEGELDKLEKKLLFGVSIGVVSWCIIVTATYM